MVVETHRSVSESLRFRWPWRDYQARVLAALDAHLADARVHVVAAPGSGKTVLGIEIFRRLGHPAVVLSPTRTVRDQWVARLADFLPEGEVHPPSWASTSLDEPGHFTSITYQALHVREQAAQEEAAEEEEADAADDAAEGAAAAVEGAAAAPGDDEIEAHCERFRRMGVKVLILDEAHHLRNAWWRALSRLIERLGDVKVVSLTATPPYEALGGEWARYEALCGPVDEEISVPELVRSGTLCPHQDFVMAVAPTAEERDAVDDYEAAVGWAVAELAGSTALLQAVLTHPWLEATEPEAPLTHPELAVALLVYLRSRDVDAPGPLLKLLGTRPEELPALDRRWWQVLVQHYLFGATWSPSPERDAHRRELARALRARGLLRRRELYLEASRPVGTHLMMSTAKLEACVEIHRLEAELRGDALRQVVLTDYIRLDEQERLGAWPVFHRLVTSLPDDHASRVALLTGRITIVHADRLPALRRLAAEAGTLVDARAVEGVDGFVRVTVAGRGAALVALLTALHRLGEVRALVGTRSLLGQGWDAPAVNSLVLASYVGAFIGTNQMRGRAIRADPADPDKAASIWHLVAFHGTTPAGLADWHGLERRFHTFAGLVEGEPVIESGLHRLKLPDPHAGATPAAVATAASLRLAALGGLDARWHQAIDLGGQFRIVPSLRVRRPPRPPRVLFRNTLHHLIVVGLSAGFLAFGQVLDGASGTPLARDRPLLLLAVAALVGLVVSAPQLVRSLVLWARVAPVDGALRQIALAVRDALIDAGRITTPVSELSLRAERAVDGSHVLALQGGTFLEQSLFADSVHEAIGPIGNPRYLITRRARFGRRRGDVHVVPQLLAGRREDAERFHHAWVRRLGPADLLFTRSAEGRRVLLEARSRAFSTAFVPSGERLDRWQ